MDPATVMQDRTESSRFGIGIARAFAGALIFALPMLMTMELWHLGFYMDRFRLVLLMIVTFPLLVGLSYYGGFEETPRLRDDIRDAFVAYAVGWCAAGMVLFVFAIIGPDVRTEEIVGKISLQAVPASIGAMLARSQMSGEDRSKDRKDRKKEHPPYGGVLFLMGVGAIFLALNVAPTEEMVLIAYKMTSWHAFALILFSLLLMHGFVYAVEFHGQKDIPEGATPPGVFLRFTVAGYALALLISLYILWTFGRTDGLAFGEILTTAVVLGFPAALGAAAARLIL